MTKPRRFLSLQIKFIIVLLLALAAGLCFATLVKVAGDYYIESVYLDEMAAAKRCQSILDRFTDYVESENLSVTANSRQIISWTRNQNHLYLMIEDSEGSIVLDSGWWDETTYYSAYEDVIDDSYDEPISIEAAALIPSSGDSTAEDSEDTDSSETEDADDTTDSDESSTIIGLGVGSASIVFADGTYRVSVYDFSEEPLYELVTVLSYALGIALFVLIMLWYHQSTIKQIIRLSREVEEIGSGNLEGHITVRHGDEIGALAQHVDSMRTSIIQEMRAEQEAWNANSDLITRMSHDIRTPLTILLGFLELLEEGHFSQDEAYESYLGICKKNAYQLKELADKLFQYFLVFGHRECEFNLEITDAQVLLNQLIGEHQVLLLEQDWQVDNQPLETGCLVNVDPVYVKRLFDNLFSNIEKYADPARPVTIRQWVDGDWLRVSIHNFVAPNPNPVESTNIGLKTCERILQQMGGNIRFDKSQDAFLAAMDLPLYREPEGQPEKPAQ